MVGRVGGRNRRTQGPSSATASRRDRRGHSVSGMARRQQLHLPRHQELSAHGRKRTRSRRSSSAVWAFCVRREVRVMRRGDQPLVITPEIRALLSEPTLLIVTKAAIRSRVHRRVYMDCVGRQALRCGRGAARRVPHRRPVHLHRLYALDALDPVSAPQGRGGARPHRLRSGRTFRQGAGQRAGELPARRAVPDRRGYALSLRPGGASARRAAARARAAAARPFRSLRIGGRVRAARALRHQRAQGDRRIISPRSTKAASARSIRSFPKGRWSAFISSSALPEGGTAASASLRASSGRSRRSCAPGPTSSASGWRGSTSRARPAACSSAIAMRSRKATGRAIRRRPRSPTSA